MFKKYVRKRGLSPFLGTVPFLLFFVFCFVAFAKAEQDLVGWWKFDEGTGDILHDSSDNRNNGRIYGATWVKSEIGYSLQFDGKDDYVDCMNTLSIELEHSLTISMWVNIPESVKSENRVGYVVSRHNWNIGIDKDLVPFFETWSVTGSPRVKMSAEKSVPTDKWVQLVAVYNVEDEFMSFYIDGEMTICKKRSDGSTGGFQRWHLLFGKEVLETNKLFKGLIGETKIYSRALSTWEIKSNYKKSNFVILHPVYGQKKLVLDFDFKRYGIEPSKVDEIDMILSRKASGDVVEHRNFKPVTIFNHKWFRTIFDMKNFSSTDFIISAVAKDTQGVQLAKNSVEFTWLPKELDKFDWLDSKAGITEEVLEPWIPVVCEQKGKDLNVKVWGRTYKFKDSPFPSVIETKEKSILAEHIQIHAKVDDRNVVWKWKSFEVTKQIPSLICFNQNAEGEGLNLSAITQVEYDGMIRIDLEITANKPLKLDELIFEIPMKVEHAKYIYRSEVNWAGTTGYVPNPPAGFLPQKTWSTSFEPTIWLGDEERGLQWFCDSEKDWYNSEPTKSIEFLPQNKVVKLRIHLVDDTIYMKPGKRVDYGIGIPVMQPKDEVYELSYTFGLHATPIKPVIKDVWDYRITHVGHVKSTTGTGERFTSLLKPGGDYNLDEFAKSGVKTIAFHAHWTDFYGGTSTPYVEDLKRLVEECHKRGIQLLPYLGFMMSNLEPSYSLLNEECVKMPLSEWDWTKRDTSPMPKQKFYDTCWRSVWQNYYADGLDRVMMDKYDVDGVYLDSTTNSFHGCKNTLHGCGLVWFDGKIKSTYQSFDNRQMMLRIYTVVKKHKPDGQVNLHNSVSLLAPTMSWVTSYWDAEHMGVVLMIRGLSTNSPILEQMPLDYFRAEFMGHQWGVAAEFLNGYIFPNTMVTIGVSLLHDVLIRGTPSFWKLSDEFGRKESEWIPYWKNKDYVSIKPEGKDVYVSLYKHPKNGVLAVVANLSEVETNVKVKLNLQKLELKNKLSATDALLTPDKLEPINISDGEFELKLSSGAWKVIWIK